MTIDKDAVTSLRKTYAVAQSHGVVALIDYLASPEAAGIRSIGSSTIGLNEIMNEIWTSEAAQQESAWMRLRSLHIGSKDGSVSPLEWLEGLSHAYGKLSEHVRTRFDDFCGAIASMVQAKPTSDVEIFTRGSIFRVPPSAYEEVMTEEELEPYRVERSRLDGD